MQTETTITIRNRWTGEMMHEVRAGDVRGALIKLVSYGADLREANLYGANLYGADLRGADLREANLYGADLRGADLREANLRGADLRGADLRGADLYGANLRGADLREANLYGAKNAPLIVYGLRWAVIINGAGQMQIGCQSHAVERWHTFSDRQIASMDSNALDFWRQHGPMLLALANSYKHEAEEMNDDT